MSSLYSYVNVYNCSFYCRGMCRSSNNGQIKSAFSKSHRDTPYIKPKISPSTTFPRPTGIVRFKPLDHSKNKAKFKFNINKKTIQDNYDFTFDVSLEQCGLPSWTVSQDRSIWTEQRISLKPNKQLAVAHYLMQLHI